ncbi:radical SAM family heme chaperone HemW [Tropicimonas sp. S265A]|uniref:radical SAM family heme chaperone HemW n=1 Tax=Tropicimonas sp. S265A TaxID=3415134 RepID=UPI003C7A8DCF
MQNWQQGGFGIYVHWPFCASKCPYCDFNSHVRAKVDQTAWNDVLLFEINRLADDTPDRLVSSVFFGGGTPSLMPPETVANIIDTIRTRWTPANNLEITLEANPGSVEAGRFAAYAEAGVTRVSLGVQALNDADLRALGRLHSAADARRAFDIARKAFSAVSFDLIYARQCQTLAQWRAELTEAVSMAVDHLSLYQLTIEPDTAFGDRFAAGKLRGLPEDTLSADMYELTQSVCDAHGLPAYEVSNHARAGAECAHNLIYWRMGDYAGVGPGAHGRLTLNGTRFATDTHKHPETWLKAVQEGGSGERPRAVLSRADQANEYLMMSLRLSEGTSVSRFEALAGHGLDPASVTHLTDLGMIEVENDILRTTLQGRLLLNAVISELLAD